MRTGDGKKRKHFVWGSRTPHLSSSGSGVVWERTWKMVSKVLFLYLPGHNHGRKATRMRIWWAGKGFGQRIRCSTACRSKFPVSAPSAVYSACAGLHRPPRTLPLTFGACPSSELMEVPHFRTIYHMFVATCVSSSISTPGHRPH